ncbi:MAG TPA: mechanosensitive ion channel protein MscS, partial [Vibrio sp.]|nr:mechanosensitive ion channel protein MscS [Vibrio sp.]
MVEFLQSNMWLKQVGLGLLLITVYWVIKRLGKNWIETLAEN